MKIKYWSAVLKEKNSTFQPSGGVEIDVKLKENTSLMNPVFIITKNISEPIRYIYWVDTLRYYFVSDVISVTNTIIEVHCAVDVLATYKTYIGQSSQYVLRSASAVDDTLIDNYYPFKAEVQTTFASSSETFDFVTDLTQGRYVLGVIGKGTNAGMGGAVTYYVLNDSQMRKLNQFLLDDIDLEIDDISEGLAKAICNPTQYIVSCMWYPFITPPISASTSSKIEVGWWELEEAGADFGLLYKDCLWEKDLSFRIPKHPLTATRGRWLNSSPYTKLVLNCSAFGCIEIDPKIYVDDTWLSIRISVDCITGTGHLVIYEEDNIGALSGVYTERYAQIGVPVQIGQNAITQGSISALAASTGSLIGGALTGNPIMIGGALAGGVGSAVQAITPRNTTISSNGSISSFSEPIQLIGEFMTPADADTANKGRPLCAVRTVNTLSGYMEIEKPHIDSYALDSEREMIDNFMRSGFYYE